MIADGPSANRPPHMLLELAALLSSRPLKTVVLGCALLAPVFLGACDRQSSDEAQPKAAESGSASEGTGMLDRSQAGSEIPDLAVSDATGRLLPLPSLKGQPVLVNLWATWCAPCVTELPTLNKVAAAMEGRLKVLTVSQDMQKTEDVAPFLEQRGLDRLEPWLDPEAELTFALGAQTLPTTILYNAQGEEVWRYTGENDWSGAEAAKLLAEAGS